jgi:hypothetical protein
MAIGRPNSYWQPLAHQDHAVIVIEPGAGMTADGHTGLTQLETWLFDTTQGQPSEFFWGFKTPFVLEANRSEEPHRGSMETVVTGESQ